MLCPLDLFVCDDGGWVIFSLKNNQIGESGAKDLIEALKVNASLTTFS
jgi:hypothetical protein